MYTPILLLHGQGVISPRVFDGYKCFGNPVKLSTSQPPNIELSHRQFELPVQLHSHIRTYFTSTLHSHHALHHRQNSAIHYPTKSDTSFTIAHKNNELRPTSTQNVNRLPKKYAPPTRDIFDKEHIHHELVKESALKAPKRVHEIAKVEPT